MAAVTRVHQVVRAVADNPEQHHDCQDSYREPPPWLPDLDRGGRFEHLGRRHRRGRVFAVVLPDKGRRVGPHHASDRADVPTSVEVPAARREVVLLDGPDDRFPDPGPLTYLRDGETGLTSRVRQGFTNAHAVPPANIVSIITHLAHSTRHQQ